MPQTLRILNPGMVTASPLYRRRFYHRYRQNASLFLKNFIFPQDVQNPQLLQPRILQQEKRRGKMKKHQSSIGVFD